MMFVSAGEMVMCEDLLTGCKTGVTSKQTLRVSEAGSQPQIYQIYPWGKSVILFVISFVCFSY